MISISLALFFTFIMGIVILFCRAFPFLFFSSKKNDDLQNNTSKTLISFVEKTVPPVAMTVLALNLISGSFKENLNDGIIVLIASVMTALLHLWRRNALLSIIGGTVLYMALKHFI